MEHIQEGQLFHLRVMYNRKYNTDPAEVSGTSSFVIFPARESLLILLCLKATIKIEKWRISCLKISY